MSYLRYSPAVDQVDPNENGVFEELCRTMQHITPNYGWPLPPCLSPCSRQEPRCVGRHTQRSFRSRRAFSAKDSSPIQAATRLPFASQPTRRPACRFRFLAPWSCHQNPERNWRNGSVALRQNHPRTTVARSTNTILRAIGIHRGSLDNIGHPYTHILGETFSTMAPIRYGDYVAKLAVAPSSDDLKELTGKHIDAGHGFNAVEELIREFFKDRTATWEIQSACA